MESLNSLQIHVSKDSYKSVLLSPEDKGIVQAQNYDETLQALSKILKKGQEKPRQKSEKYFINSKNIKPKTAI